MLLPRCVKFADTKSHVNPATYACEPNVLMHGFSADLTTTQNYGRGWFEVNSWKASGKSHLFLKGMKYVCSFSADLSYDHAHAVFGQI